MKIKPYLDKMNESGEFKKFISDNPDAYFSAGFFVLDFVDKHDIHQIDYYMPNEKKIMTITLDNEFKMKKQALSNESIPKEVEGDINLDLDILKLLVEDEMKNQNITHKLHKIIAILHNLDGKKTWDLNCITSDMGIIKVHVNDTDKSILKFEPVSLFDVVKKVSK